MEIRVGQLVAFVVFDHLGHLGLTRKPVTITRLPGCAGLIASRFCSNKT